MRGYDAGQMPPSRLGVLRVCAVSIAITGCGAMVFHTAVLSPAANDGMADRSNQNDVSFRHSLRAGSAVAREPAMDQLRSHFLS